MSSVYVVFGERGEYSDHSYWSVAAYLSKDKADQHAEKANERAKEIWELRHSAVADWWTVPEDDPMKYNQWDPTGASDYDETTYGVEEIEIGGRWPRPPTTP